MESLVSGDLTIDTQAASPGPIRCVWKGKSNSRHPDQVLSPYFQQVLASASSSKSGVEMRFEELDHFNSSTITCLIQLIQEARSSGVKLTLVYDNGLKWQKLSFDALRAFERGDGLFELRHAGADR